MVLSPQEAPGGPGALGSEPAPPLAGRAQPTPVDVLREILRRARGLTSALHCHEVLRLSAETACQVLGYQACGVALRGEGGTFRYEALVGGSADEERQLRRCVVSTGVYEAVVDASVAVGPVYWLPPGSKLEDDPEVGPALLRTGVSGPAGSWQEGSLLLVPLVDAGGTAVGFLAPEDPRSGDLPGAVEAMLLGSLAELTEIALETVCAREAAQQARVVAETQRRQLEELLAASVAVRGRDALDDVLGEISRTLTRAGGFRRAGIHLLEEDRRTLRVRCTVSLEAPEDRRLRDTPYTLDEIAAVMQPDMRVSRSYLFDHRRHEMPAELDAKMVKPAPDPDWVDGAWHPLDMLTVPLLDPDGELLGVLSVDEPVSGQLPGPPQVRTVEMFADQCSLAVVEARRYEKALAEAGADPLTGLANRRALLTRAGEILADAERRRLPCTVGFLDLDHFKEVNDRWGHAVGDEVLVEVSRAMAERLRSSDLVARYGGEEFVVVLPGTRLDRAVGIIEGLRRRVAALELPKLGRHRVSISGGVALVRPGETLAEVFARADAALYAAKNAGRDRLSVADAA